VVVCACSSLTGPASATRAHVQSLVDEEVALRADHLLALWTLVMGAVSGRKGSTTGSTAFLLLGKWSLHKRGKGKEVVVGASQMWGRY